MGKVSSTIHVGPIVRMLLKRARPNRRFSSYDYLFVLPAVPRGSASGGYRVVYELSRRLSQDGFRVVLVFLVDNRLIGRSESRRQWLHRFPLSVALVLRDESYLETVRKIVTNRKMYERFHNENPLFLQLGFESEFYKLSKPIENRGSCILIPLLKNESKGSVYGTNALGALKLEDPGISILSYGDLEPSEVPSFVDCYFGQHAIRAYSGPRNPVLKNMYNTAAVFVLPSLIEGFSLPTLEAMHCGCAVVVTDNGGVN